MNSRVDPRRQAAAFLADLSLEKHGAASAAPRAVAPASHFVASAPRPVAPAPSLDCLPDGALEIGKSEQGWPIGLKLAKLIEGRLLVQGASGAGKSWTLRRLLEQSARSIQQIIVDPEGEFGSLAEAFGHTVLDGAKLDGAALEIAAQRAREHRLNVLLDLSEVDRETQMVAVTAFIGGLIGAPREHWTPVLVAIDEAHLFAPLGAAGSEAPSIRRASIHAVTDLMSLGRKRGLAGVLATQRIARMAKSVVSGVHSYLIGLNVLDLDIRRAAETIGWDARRAFDRLPMLEPGDFVAVGPAFTRSPSVLRVGSIETQHRGATPPLSAATAVSGDAAARLLDLAALEEQTARDADARGEPKPWGGRAVRAFISEPAFPLAAAVYGAIRPLAPDGARIDDIVAHLSSTRELVDDAIALLESVAAVDVDEVDAAVRLARFMR